jgi:hypothetical protein
MLKVHKIFPTALLQFPFNNHQKYFFSEIHETVRKPDNWDFPINTSFPNISKDDNFIYLETQNSLKIDLLQCIKDSLKKINLPDNIDFLNFWYNVYHGNQGQEPHWHLPSVGNVMPYWAGIYYNKNCNPTIFHRDHGSHRTHNFLGIENSEIKDCSWIEYLPDISDGDVLLFPPHLIHSVRLDLQHKKLMRLKIHLTLKLIHTTKVC